MTVDILAPGRRRADLPRTRPRCVRPSPQDRRGSPPILLGSADAAITIRSPARRSDSSRASSIAATRARSAGRRSRSARASGPPARSALGRQIASVVDDAR